MIVYNTTFHVEKVIHAECLNYLKRRYIPDVMASGLLHTPSLRRVMQTAEEEGLSYSVQFLVHDVDTLNRWLANDGVQVHTELVARFGHQLAGFSTLLEEIDWAK